VFYTYICHIAESNKKSFKSWFIVINRAHKLTSKSVTWLWSLSLRFENHTLPLAMVEKCPCLHSSTSASLIWYFRAWQIGHSLNQTLSNKRHIIR
jgi:hypothetical protein